MRAFTEEWVQEHRARNERPLEFTAHFRFPRSRRGATIRGKPPARGADGKLADGTPFVLFGWQGNSGRRFLGLSFEVDGEEILAIPECREGHVRGSLGEKLIAWAEMNENLAAMGFVSIAALEAR